MAGMQLPGWRGKPRPAGELWEERVPSTEHSTTGVRNSVLGTHGSAPVSNKQTNTLPKQTKNQTQFVSTHADTEI